MQDITNTEALRAIKREHRDLDIKDKLRSMALDAADKAEEFKRSTRIARYYISYAKGILYVLRNQEGILAAYQLAKTELGMLQTELRSHSLLDDTENLQFEINIKRGWLDGLMATTGAL